MNLIKKERSKSYNYQNTNYTEIPKERSRGMSTLSSKHSGRELGVVEKLLSSYGFVQPTGEGTSIFFHYSEFIGDINSLQLGESLSFLVRSDRRSGKPVAVQLARASSIPPQVNGFSKDEVVLSYSVKGVVEVQARLASDNGYHSNLASVGRVAYEKDGATYFLPYSGSDVDIGQYPKRGEKVMFCVVQDKTTRDLNVKQMRVLASDDEDDTSDSGNETSHTGVISSLKDAFGFIERGDMVSEIFFHYSQFDGDRSDLVVGADVGFDIQTRNGKEVGTNVVRLPSGSVVFEDESTETYKGEVVKIANRGRLNSSMSDDQLSGVLEYTDGGDLVDITYGHRDISQNANLRVGDMVEFKISTDRRDGLQRAVSVTAVHCKQSNGHQRELGVVCNLREGFGFIKCCDRDTNVFFHFSEVMEKMNNLSLSDEVEFNVEKDESGRLSASKITILPKGSVEFEELSEEIYEGVVKREPNGLGLKSPTKGTKDSELGIISFYDDEEVEVTFKPRDCKPREFPQVGDEVEFCIATNKRNGQLSAKDVSVIKRHRSARQTGFVCAMKENYGFIETVDHTTDVFFHFSESNNKVDDLCLGDEVGFTVVRKNGKQCAEDVKRLKKGTLPQEDVLDGVYEGKVVRPVRTVDPDQPTYEGIVSKLRSKLVAMDEKRSEAEASLSTESSLVEEDEEQQPEDSQEQECYPFGITSLVDKKDPLHPGDKVTFQLGVDKDGRQRAVCICCVRQVLRARVESIKGQFGFIAHETSDGKNLFFHMSEVDDSGGLVDPGDMVEFIIVKSHKNAKLSAMRVKRISDSPKPGHLLRRRDNTPIKATFIAIRVPTIPDGTIGFKNRKIGEREQ